MTVLDTTSAAVERTATARRYLMCRPEHFAVAYAINPWMDPTRPVDRDRALVQWDALRATYERLGHVVELAVPVPGLPDMVFAANGGVVVGDRVLAGTGYRTDPGAHAEAAEVLGVEVISLELVDPRYYHLDTCLAALDGGNVAYYPAAFSPAGIALLELLYPDAVLASQADAEVLGLNFVSDGRHVVLTQDAPGLAAQLAEAGYVPVPVDLSELLKAGGGVKCCTLELRA